MEKNINKFIYKNIFFDKLSVDNIMQHQSNYSKTTDDIADQQSGPILQKMKKINIFNRKFGASKITKIRNSVSEDKENHYAPFKISK